MTAEILEPTDKAIKRAALLIREGGLVTVPATGLGRAIMDRLARAEGMR